MYLLVNFGGPRHLEEIEPFLTSLLLDREVVRTQFPRIIHDWFFKRIAKKRALKVRKEYEKIGGKSPIYDDTEFLAQTLSNRLQAPVLSFHRYLPATHQMSMQQIKTARGLIVLPLFPQFCYATTGSVARFFQEHLPCVESLRWIQTFAAHPAFVASWQRKIRDFLTVQGIQEGEVILLFSAHGVPQVFVDEGDPYKKECESSFHAIMEAFPHAKGQLAYQSKFGRGEWIKPYTETVCKSIGSLERPKVVIVPLSFTSDHIETLYEIEEQYLPLIRANQRQAFRCPALNREPYWIDALVNIVQDAPLMQNHRLVRKR